MIEKIQVFYNRVKHANKKWFVIGVMIKLFKYAPFYTTTRNILIKKFSTKQLKIWETNGHIGSPPHIIKQQVLKSFASKYNLKILVETGTFYGDMVDSMKDNFDEIYSIELDKFLYNKAKKRFSSENHIKIIHGDSSEKIKQVMNYIKKPTLFWLDGHYSGGETARGNKDTPIYEELQTIFDASDLGHVIIIDDARCFGTDSDYPSVDELKKFIFSKKSNVIISMEYDSIRIIPKI